MKRASLTRALATAGALTVLGNCAKAPEQSEARLSYREAERAQFIEAVGDKYQCAKACGGAKPTPYCRAVPISAQYRTGLRNLANRLSSGQTTIPKAVVMADFGAQTDPCNRGDSRLENGRWVNRGESCLMAANIDAFGDGKPVKIELVVPPEMGFRTAADSLGRHYRAEGGGVTLRIYDEGLHNDWGGALADVIDRPGDILLQMPRGCLKVEKGQ